MLLAALLMICSGIALCTIAWAAEGRDLLDRWGLYLHQGEPQYQQQEYLLDAAELQRLRVETAADAIRVYRGGEQIQISCQESQYYCYQLEIDDGELQLSYQAAEGERSLPSVAAAPVDIWLPEDSLARAQISIKSVSGDIYLERLSGAVLSAETVSGTISFEDCGWEEMTLTTISGDICGTLSGDSEDYQIDCRSLTGDIWLPQGTENAPRQLKLDSVSGDIRIDFSRNSTEEFVSAAR